MFGKRQLLLLGLKHAVSYGKDTYPTFQVRRSLPGMQAFPKAILGTSGENGKNRPILKSIEKGGVKYTCLVQEIIQYVKKTFKHIEGGMKMFKNIIKIFMLVALILSLTLTAGLSEAQVFKKGDTIRFLVPYSPGGGYDIYVRLISPFWEEEIEKQTGVNVSVIVQNMPGAGGELCYTKLDGSRPDGKTVAIVHSAGAVSRQAFLKVPYDVKKWVYIGQIAFTAPGFSIRSDLKLWSFWDAIERSKKKPLIIGTAGYGDGTHLHPLFTKLFLEKGGKEVNFKYVHFKGYSEVRASMARKEVEGAIGTPE